MKDVLASMTSSFTVKEEEMEGRRFLFLNHLHQAERFIAARIRLMTGFPPVANPYIEAGIDAIERSNHIRYEGQQRLAITEAVEKGTLILTGGPGTGKTTTLRAIITLLEGMGESVAIAAPTGRAAKRIAELTGCEAKTIHRLAGGTVGRRGEPDFRPQREESVGCGCAGGGRAFHGGRAAV